MSAGHQTVPPAAPGSVEQQHHTALLEQLLADPKFSAAVQAYTKEDDSRDIPFLGGSNNAGDTVFFDRRFVEAVKAGKVLYDGKPFDPRPFLKIHEAVEGAAIRLLGTNYDTDNAKGLPGGHLIATWAERRAVQHAGLDWVKYQAALKPWIRADEHEQVTNPPPDLLTVPYRGTPQAREVEKSPGGYVPAADQDTQGPVAQKITRDGFGYMEPDGDDDDDEFAQCATCVMRVNGELKCGVMGARAVPADGTCVEYIEGDGIPAPIANLPPDEIGYTVRPVRCENCEFGGSDDCALYADLNQARPQIFDLDTKIKPQGCCNANTPKGEDMANLTSKGRNSLSGSQFGLPGERKYPMPDRSHAANAKARATQQVKAGNLSPSAKAQIDAKANRVLGKSPGGYAPNPLQMDARGHALSMASATHLHNAGHMPAAQRAAIHAKARAGIAALKGAPAPMPFGSLAPSLPEQPGS